MDDGWWMMDGNLLIRPLGAVDTGESALPMLLGPSRPKNKMLPLSKIYSLEQVKGVFGLYF